MPFAEDLTVFFADFGDNGTLAGQPVRGIYDAPFAVESMGAAGVLATEPSFRLASSSVPGNIFGAALVIPQGSFTVREAHPDGTGLTTLLLSKAT